MYLIRRYTTSASGSAKRRIDCEKCGVRYVFEVSRYVEGVYQEGLRTDRAEAREGSQHLASRNLHKALSKAVEPVPCPRCGWLQSDMVVHLKKHHKRGMHKLGLILSSIGAAVGLLFGLIVFHPAVDPSVYVVEAVAGSACLIGAGLLLLRIALARNLDPNADYSRRAGMPSEAVVVPVGVRSPIGAASAKPAASVDDG